MRTILASVVNSTAAGRRSLRWIHRRSFWRVRPEDAAQLAFYGAFIAAGDLVFDVGANRGTRSRILHRLGARVVAFEPQPALASLLRYTFANTPVRIAELALGDTESASAPMFTSRVDLYSSLSPEWIATIKNSKRFGPLESWEHRGQIPVRVRTLDAAIEEYGLPSFTKIDVEGYELQVLSGLSRALPALSFEFATETLETTRKCVRRIASLSDYRFQVSFGESMRFEATGWLTADEMIACIDTTLAGVEGGWGDLYARRWPPSGSRHIPTVRDYFARLLGGAPFELAGEPPR
jgi:FkbM family methyltransferase